MAQQTSAWLGYLPEAANSAGGWLTGALPHRLPGGQLAPIAGLDVRAMLETSRKAYVLIGVEPELDCWDGAAALKAMQSAEQVIALSPYASAVSKQYAKSFCPLLPSRKLQEPMSMPKGAGRVFRARPNRLARRVQPGRSCACWATCVG